MDYGNRPKKLNSPLFMYVSELTCNGIAGERTIQSHPVWFFIHFFVWFRRATWLCWFQVPHMLRAVGVNPVRCSSISVLDSVCGKIAVPSAATSPEFCCAFHLHKNMLRSGISSVYEWNRRSADKMLPLVEKQQSLEFACQSTIVIDENGRACIC